MTSRRTKRRKVYFSAGSAQGLSSCAPAAPRGTRSHNFYSRAFRICFGWPGGDHLRDPCPVELLKVLKKLQVLRVWDAPPPAPQRGDTKFALDGPSRTTAVTNKTKDVILEFPDVFSTSKIDVTGCTLPSLEIRMPKTRPRSRPANRYDFDLSVKGSILSWTRLSPEFSAPLDLTILQPSCSHL